MDATDDPTRGQDPGRAGAALMTPDSIPPNGQRLPSLAADVVLACERAAAIGLDPLDEVLSNGGVLHGRLARAATEDPDGLTIAVAAFRRRAGDEAVERLEAMLARRVEVTTEQAKGNRVEVRTEDGIFRPTARPPVEWVPAAALLSASPEIAAWAVPGLAPKGAVALLAGAPKSGKSWLTWAAIRAAQAGRPGLVEDGSGESLGPALYLSEEGGGTLAAKLRRWPLAADFLLRRRVQSSWADIVAAVADRVAKTGAGLVIVDTLGAWLGLAADRENDAAAVAGAVAPLAALAEQTGAGVLAIHHVRKAAAPEAVHRVRGSGALAAAVDHVVLLERSGSDCRLTTHGRYDGLPEAIRFSIDEETGALARGAGDGADGSDAILEVLVAGRGTARDLATRASLSEREARRRLTRHVDGGRVRSLGGRPAVYELAAGSGGNGNHRDLELPPKSEGDLEDDQTSGGRLLPLGLPLPPEVPEADSVCNRCSGPVAPGFDRCGRCS